MDDFNSSIGEGKEGDIIGQYGLGERNRQGQLLVEYCKEKKFCIKSTSGVQAKERRHIWVSPNGKLEKQIDYILINQRYRNCLRQSRPITKPDCGTDHNMVVVGKIKIHLNKIWKIKMNKRLNTNVLMKNEELKQRYEEEINKNIKDTDGNWRNIKHTIRNTAKKVLTTAKMEARKP